MNQKRSPSRFLIVSGTYLFLILLASTIQPVLGYKPCTDLTELRNSFFLPVWCLIPLIAIVNGKIEREQKGKEWMRSGTMFFILILSVISHFILNAGDNVQLDNFTKYDVITGLRLIAASVSVVFLGLAAVFSSKKAGVVLLILEFIFWTLKALMYYNASTDLIFVGYYTVICYVLRLTLIMKLISKEKTIAHTAA